MQYPRKGALKAQAAGRVEVSDNEARVGTTRPSVGTVGLCISQRNVQLMERSASLARRKGTSNNSAGALSTGTKAVTVIAKNLGGICMMWTRTEIHLFSWRTMIQSVYELCIL